MQSFLSRRTVLKAGAGLVSLPLLARAAHADASLDPTQDPTFNRSLVFDEGFERIDPAIWHAGPKAGTADGGFYGRSAFSRIDGEEGFNPYAIVDDPETENGKALRISVKYIGQPMNVPKYYGNNLPEFQWISGNLQTAQPDGTILKGWRRGYFEARMRFPAHPLTWPAFWFLNGRSILHPRTSIELDVVEHKGFEPRLYGAYLHEWGQPGERHQSSGVPTDVDMTEGYNLYGILLVRNKCVVYFNRKPIRSTFNGEPLVWTMGRSAEMDVKNDVFWAIFTLALRSDYAYPNPLLPEHHLAHMRVDYFRVYQ
ncbi:MAG: 1,3-beta-glucanase [Pseudochelatococcus sp.]|jgi:beta-glucanase (GH16 family)|uniref:1,3-beta-glucanase n=1 Tax=Pseudochelatococcus sp. TaxID=2020869 RepID=UPI003D8D82C9